MKLRVLGWLAVLALPAWAGGPFDIRIAKDGVVTIAGEKMEPKAVQAAIAKYLSREKLAAADAGVRIECDGDAAFGTATDVLCAGALAGVYQYELVVGGKTVFVNLRGDREPAIFFPDGKDSGALRDKNGNRVFQLYVNVCGAENRDEHDRQQNGHAKATWAKEVTKGAWGWIMGDRAGEKDLAAGKAEELAKAVAENAKDPGEEVDRVDVILRIDPNVRCAPVHALLRALAAEGFVEPEFEVVAR